MKTYRLRFELPPHDDARARVGEVIDRFDGTIVAEELQERDGQRAVEEVVVALPDVLDSAALRVQLDQHAATTLLSSGEDPGTESVALALHWAQLILGAAPEHRHRTVREAIEEACPYASVDIVTDVSAATGPDGAGPALLRIDYPVERGSARTRSGWLLEIPERAQHPRWIARLTRPVSLRFTAAEVRRARALVAIASFAEDIPRPAAA
jgi:hypothetical protein